MRPQLKISSCPTSLTSDILTDFGFRLSAFLFFCVSQLSLLRRLRVYTQLIFDCFPTAIFLSSLLSSLCGTSFILWSWSIVTPTPALCTSLFISRWAQAQFLIVSQLAISSLSPQIWRLQVEDAESFLRLKTSSPSVEALSICPRSSSQD